MLKKNKRNIILITITCIFIFIILIIIGMQFINNSDGKRVKEEYEKLNRQISKDGKEYPTVNIEKNNIIKYTTEEEIIKIIKNKKNAVVYIGSPSCIYCRTVIEVLLDTAKETGLDVIYYLDIEVNNNNDELIKIVGNELTTENKLYAPSVIFIVEGEIISYHKDTVYSQKDPYEELDESQIKGLSEIYRYGINEVIKSKN